MNLWAGFLMSTTCKCSYNDMYCCYMYTITHMYNCIHMYTCLNICGLDLYIHFNLKIDCFIRRFFCSQVTMDRCSFGIGGLGTTSSECRPLSSLDPWILKPVSSQQSSISRDRVCLHAKLTRLSKFTKKTRQRYGA